MEYSIDGDARICPEDYLDEELSIEEREGFLKYERRFQKLIAQILDAHHAEIKEFVEECMGWVREELSSEDEELCECCEEKEGTNDRNDCGCKMLCDDCVVNHDRECKDYNEENSQTSESEED